VSGKGDGEVEAKQANKVIQEVKGSESVEMEVRSFV
jgi:hypothetical protein